MDSPFVVIFSINACRVCTSEIEFFVSQSFETYFSLGMADVAFALFRILMGIIDYLFF